jgi:Tfp pilus assembly protein PilF
MEVRTLALLPILVALFAAPLPGPQTPEKDPAAIFQRAQTALVNRDYVGAEKGFQEVLRLDPRSAAAFSNLGVAYQRLGRFQEAGKEFDTEMTVTPQEPWSYENRGLVCLDLGQTDAAIKYFRLALARNSQLPKSLAGLAKAYLH